MTEMTEQEEQRLRYLRERFVAEVIRQTWPRLHFFSNSLDKAMEEYFKESAVRKFGDIEKEINNEEVLAHLDHASLVYNQVGEKVNDIVEWLDSLN